VSCASSTWCFNEGYAATAGEEMLRRELCAEAIRLGRMLRALLPGEGEVAGLLALMLLQDSRRAARIDAAGELVTLEEQTAAAGTRRRIAEAVPLAEAALRRGGAGFYAIQAVIAALHAEAGRAADTDWRQIAILYTLLLRAPPIAGGGAQPRRGGGYGGRALARAGTARGDRAARPARRLPPAAGREGRSAAAARSAREAAEAHRQALGLVTQEAERRYLLRRLAEVAPDTE
jgi:RNA polymerase sigma-70 factor (ECF subfamily)